MRLWIRNWSYGNENLLKLQGFYRFFLHVTKVILIFFNECFFTHLKNYLKQSRLFGANRIGSKTLISWILQTFKFKSTTDSVWGSTWFIHFYELCNYLYSFLRQPVSFYENNNCFFADQRNVGHHTNKFIETGPDLFIKYHLRTSLRGFMVLQQHLLLILILTYN